MVTIEQIEDLVKNNWDKLCPCSRCDIICESDYTKCHLRGIKHADIQEMLQMGVQPDEILAYCEKER